MKMLMRKLFASLLLVGCARSVGPGDDPGFDLRGGADAAAADLASVDLTVSPTPDLRPPEDLAAPDLRADLSTDDGPPGAVPRVNEVAPGLAGVAADEFVELIGGAADLDLKSWSLRYQSAAGSEQILLNFGSLTLPRGGYVLVAAAGGTYEGMADVTFLPGGQGRLAKAGGAVGLFDGLGQKVDALSWGTAAGSYVEGAPAAAPDDKSCSRLPDGADTNNNAADARTGTVTPRAKNQP